MLGEYIADRWIVSMIRELCQQKGISFASWSDDWILELQKDALIHRIIGYRFGLNDAVASSISQDKVATYTVLERHDIPAVEHVLVRTKISHANEALIKNWQQIVIKPLVGTSGHGVQLFQDSHTAAAFIESSLILAWAASPYVAIKREIRIILLDGSPLLCYEKRAVQQDALKMFNLGLGATPVDIEPDDTLVSLARKAQDALQLRVAAIDIVEDEAGEYRVLEVNDAIMTEYYARVSEENKTRAKDVYGAILEAMFEMHYHKD